MPFHLPSAVLNHDRIFYSWDCSIIQYQTMCKPSVELGLVYKTFINEHTWKTLLLPRKTNCIHCLRNAGFFRKLNKVIFPSQPKTHFFRDILSERVPCSRKSCVDGRTLSLAPVDVCMGSFSRGKCPYKSSTVIYISKSHDLKNSQKLGRTRKWGLWHRNTVQIVFLKLCPCLAWETKS